MYYSVEDLAEQEQITPEQAQTLWGQNRFSGYLEPQYWQALAFIIGWLVIGVWYLGLDIGLEIFLAVPVLMILLHKFVAAPLASRKIRMTLSHWRLNDRI